MEGSSAGGPGLMLMSATTRWSHDMGVSIFFFKSYPMLSHVNDLSKNVVYKGPLRFLSKYADP